MLTALKALAGVAAFLYAITMPPVASTPVEVRTNPRVAHPGKPVTVFVKVEPHEDNRWLNISISSPNRYESTTEQLEGIHAPEVRTVSFHRLPAGRYIVSADLQRKDDKTLHSETTFCLIGMNEPCTE